MIIYVHMHQLLQEKHRELSQAFRTHAPPHHSYSIQCDGSQGEQTGAYTGLKYGYTKDKGILLGLGSTPAEARTVPRLDRESMGELGLTGSSHSPV